ncbi:MAG: zf-TFIIB domain-containing protein [Nitrospiria bacterium]
MDTQPCLFCHKTINVKSRLCPFCGGENTAEAIHETPVCPRCKTDLRRHDYRETVLDACASCGGLWLDTREFKQLTSKRDVFADETIPYAFQKKPLPQEAGYFSCPLCDDLMLRQNFRKISGVLIDQCRDHGVWLDGGELDQLRCFIANGGLDQSQDRDIMMHREEISAIAAKVKNVEFMQRILNRWKLKYWLFKG